jgi:hypothetical protein
MQPVPFWSEQTPLSFRRFKGCVKSNERRALPLGDYSVRRGKPAQPWFSCGFDGSGLTARSFCMRERAFAPSC